MVHVVLCNTVMDRSCHTEYGKPIGGVVKYDNNLLTIILKPMSFGAMSLT